MSSEEDILKTVDDIVDCFDLDDLVTDAARLGITISDLMGRVGDEVKARIEG